MTTSTIKMIQITATSGEHSVKVRGMNKKLAMTALEQMILQYAIELLGSLTC